MRADGRPSRRAHADFAAHSVAAGASGFVAGRAIWREAVELTDEARRQEFMKTEMQRRFELLAEIAERTARPWFEVPSHRYDPASLVPEGWYEPYPSF